jgi:hypothetical protein
VVAMLVLERDSRWLPLWVLTVLALSLTRDNTLVLFVAVAWTAYLERTRRAAWLAGTGLAASLPVPLIFSVPVREQLAWLFDNHRIPADSSWGFILREFPEHLAYLAKADLTHLFENGFPFTLLGVALAVAGLAYLFITPTGADRFLALHRAAAVGGLLLLIAQPAGTGYRLELVLLPAAAVGAALAVSHIRARFRGVAPVAPSPGTAPP